MNTFKLGEGLDIVDVVILVEKFLLRGYNSLNNKNAFLLK